MVFSSDPACSSRVTTWTIFMSVMIVLTKPLDEPAYSDLHGGIGSIAHVGHQCADVGVRIRNVTGLKGLQHPDCFFPEALFQHLDVAQQFHRPVTADVVNPIWRGARSRIGFTCVPACRYCRYMIERAQDPFDDVVDVGEIAAMSTVVEQLD